MRTTSAYHSICVTHDVIAFHHGSDHEDFRLLHVVESYCRHMTVTTRHWRDGRESRSEILVARETFDAVHFCDRNTFQ